MTTDPMSQPPPQGPPSAPPPPPVPPYAPTGFGPPPPQYAYAPPPAQPAPAGPEFLAVDKNNSVVVDESGVAFEAYGLNVDFPWPEIRSVHYQAGPNGKVLMVAVIPYDGRVYECVVDAKSRDRLREWFAQLAPVLGYYRPMG
ncbi:hypothetical protein [Streptomyces sp. NPDC002088]|uniref:hypothetical protein n=1 Tax=Streptomyces sp. NPDC002088 TaxID=3154665 RepID=UPI003330EE84